MIYLKIFLLIVGIVWIIVYLFHYHYFVDQDKKDNGGFLFALLFFIVLPYVVIKAIKKTKAQKRS